MDESLRAVEVALRKEQDTTNRPKPIDIAEMLDHLTMILEEARSQVDDVRRRLSLIQKTIGG